VPRLVDALEHGRLRLFHQRLLPLQRGAGRDPLCEVLLRFVDERGQLVAPTEFIGPAERFNLMPTVDRWVVDHALELLGSRADSSCADQGCRMLINLSGSSIGDESFPDFVVECLERHRVPPAAIGFELTETAVVRDLLHARTFMQALGGLGCRFALDDFGSGMCSFAYLRALPVHLLKIDGSFVREMAGDVLARAIVEAVHRVSRAVGLETVAECIEDQPTLELARDLGLDHGQGYAIHRPEPI
jgi:EAL domain-containing protein (putative c-di-GMP-specific phosphodiesterase class I)